MLTHFRNCPPISEPKVLDQFVVSLSLKTFINQSPLAPLDGLDLAEGRLRLFRLAATQSQNFLPLAAPFRAKQESFVLRVLRLAAVSSEMLRREAFVF